MSKYNIPTVEELLEAGVHFGHQARRWNPKMNKYIYSSDQKSHVIDVFQTHDLLSKACDFLYETAKSGKQIVIVGTKRQAVGIVEEKAKAAGALYVTERWLGGTFTNFESVRSNWKQLQELRQGVKESKFDKYTKKERLLIDRKIARLAQLVGGIQDMTRYPGAIVIIDVKRERTAVQEARAVKVPVVGIIDTNSDPDMAEYPIPANDDAIKSLNMLIGVMADAIAQGYADRPKEEAKPAEKRAAAVAAAEAPKVVKKEAKSPVVKAKAPKSEKKPVKVAKTAKVTKAAKPAKTAKPTKAAKKTK